MRGAIEFVFTWDKVCLSQVFTNSTCKVDKRLHNTSWMSHVLLLLMLVQCTASFIDFHGFMNNDTNMQAYRNKFGDFAVQWAVGFLISS